MPGASLCVALRKCAQSLGTTGWGNVLFPVRVLPCRFSLLNRPSAFCSLRQRWNVGQACWVVRRCGGVTCCSRMHMPLYHTGWQRNSSVP